MELSNFGNPLNEMGGKTKPMRKVLIDVGKLCQLWSLSIWYVSFPLGFN